MKKFAVLTVACCAIFVFLNSCSKDKEKGPIFTLITDVGGVNDQSFNQGGWEGLQAFKKDHPMVTVNYFESKTEADYSPFLQNAVDNNASLIFAMGFKMGDAIKEASSLYPDNKFVIVDFEYNPLLPNVECVHSRVEEASYLAGYMAAKVSKNKKLGFIGGFELPIIDQFECGFRAGAHAADPKVQVFTQYAVSFTDADKGKAIAQSMAEVGVDVLFAAAGDVGTGVIELARERNLWAIGVDRDQAYLAPEHVLTSVVRYVNNVTYTISQDLLKGKFESGTSNMGLREGAVGLAEVNKKMASEKELLAQVEEQRELIISGNVKVPTNKKELAAMGIAAK